MHIIRSSKYMLYMLVRERKIAYCHIYYSYYVERSSFKELHPYYIEFKTMIKPNGFSLASFILLANSCVGIIPSPRNKIGIISNGAANLIRLFR